MRDGDAATGEIGKHGLDVAGDRTAGGGVARVPNRLRAFQLFGMRAVLSEHIADETRMTFGNELRAVVSDDARRFLSAMLERMQAEHRQRAGVGVSEHAEHSAFFVESILGDRHRLSLPDCVVAMR